MGVAVPELKQYVHGSIPERPYGVSTPPPRDFLFPALIFFRVPSGCLSEVVFPQPPHLLAPFLSSIPLTPPSHPRYMDKKLRLKLNGNRGVVGVLRGFDQFLNLVLDECVNDGGDEELLGMVVVRGNSVTAMEALEHIPPAVRRA